MYTFEIMLHQLGCVPLANLQRHGMHILDDL